MADTDEEATKSKDKNFMNFPFKEQQNSYEELYTYILANVVVISTKAKKADVSKPFRFFIIHVMLFLCLSSEKLFHALGVVKWFTIDEHGISERKETIFVFDCFFVTRKNEASSCKSRDKFN